MNVITKSLTVASLATVMVAQAGAQGIQVSVNNVPVMFHGTMPQSINGRVMVPLRGVFEQLGAYVNWDPQTREVCASQGNKEIRLLIGDSNATVNGESVTLDSPARIVNGSTLVPLRFLSESLGARVDWSSANRMVMIQTNGEGRAQRLGDRDPNQGSFDQPRRLDRNKDHRNTQSDNAAAYATLTTDTVIPVRLDDRINSADSRQGDKFSTTLKTNNSDYDGLPFGTKIEGHVVTARPQNGSHPGVIELAFDRVVFPSGKTYDIDGSLFSLDDKAISRRPDGRIVARPTEKNKRVLYAGYGAGAGLLLGALTKRPLEDTVLGGLLGYAAGSAEKSQKQPSNVDLSPGTEFGVKLNRDLALRRD